MSVYSCMAFRTVVKHYTNECDLDDCLTVSSAARVFLKGGRTTTDGNPFIDGTVSALNQRSDGGYDLSFTYSEVTAPVGYIMVFPTASAAGNACDPDCMSECSWMWKVQKLIDGIDQNALIKESYQIVPQNTHLSNSTTYIPREIFATGFNLTAVKLTCHKYDSGTTAVFTLRYRTTANALVADSSLPVCASYTGNLSAQKGLTITVPVIPYDAELVLVISGTATTVYADSTLGLTLQTAGFIVP